MSNVLNVLLESYIYDEYLYEEYGGEDGETFALKCPVCSKYFTSNTYNTPLECIKEGEGLFSCNHCKSNFKLLNYELGDEYYLRESKEIEIKEGEFPNAQIEILQKGGSNQ